MHRTKCDTLSQKQAYLCRQQLSTLKSFPQNSSDLRARPLLDRPSIRAVPQRLASCAGPTCNSQYSILPAPFCLVPILPCLARWNEVIVCWNSATLLRLSGGDADASHSIRIAETSDSIEYECQSVIRNDKGRNTS